MLNAVTTNVTSVSGSNGCGGGFREAALIIVVLLEEEGCPCYK